MLKRYAAFVSYAHHYKSWVGEFQQNLERSLSAVGAEPGKVFLDQVDLGSGHSWVAQLQEGLARSDQLILIAAPEALASSRVQDEWEGFIASERNWARGKFHVVMLVDTPLPPFIDRMQCLDFVDHDYRQYHRELRKLVGALVGRSSRHLPGLPDKRRTTVPPVGVLPTGLRRRLVGCLARLLRRKAFRPTVAAALGIHPTAMEGYATLEGAGSAALVVSTGDDDRVEAATRVVMALRDAFEEEEDAKLLAELDHLKEEFTRLRPEGRGLLEVWLERVHSDHSNLVPFFEHADLELLDRVYVQLELRPEERLRRGGEDSRAQLDHQLTIRELLALNPEQHGLVAHRWMVLGDPGAGKTTLLRHLATRLAIEDKRRWIPVFETLPQLMRKPEWLLDRLEREMKKAGAAAQGLAAALDREGQEGRLLLLLDGLDEVPRSDREQAEALLRQVSKRWSKSALVVTSRKIGYRRPSSEFLELELLPFDEGQKRQFLEQWIGSGASTSTIREVETVMQSLADDTGLHDLASNPLYLTLIALLFERGQSPEHNRSRLYEQVFQLLLDGRHRSAARAIDLQEAVRALLRRLACDMTHDDRDAEPKSKIEARLYQDEYDKLRDPLERLPDWRRSLSPFLDDVAEKTGILGPHDGATAEWRYWHRTFREALTAEQLAEDLNTGGDDKIQEKARAVKGNEGRWAEPFALLVGRVADPDTLVMSLAEANWGLGLRAVATAQRLRDETLQEVLNLTNKWTERRDIYRQIPEVIDDPERALALVERLRRRCRNGNDLYHLERTARTIADRWPDAGTHAARILERFFDHIPEPPEDLFRWIEIPGDERVELWREIPSGEGWIGSPEGEGHDDERPRHRVTVAKPFAMAAVPVTNAQYSAFDPDHQWWEWEGVTREELAYHPAVAVSWYAAMAFCRWLEYNGLAGARLPIEEEWEYACRAGTTTRYWSGNGKNDLAQVGWYDANSQGRTHRVGEKPANPWGLYDIHGNVREWTLTALNSLEAYEGRDEGIDIVPSDLAVLSSGDGRVIRGGGFSFTALRSRASYRLWWYPWSEEKLQGFRVVSLCESHKLTTAD